MSTRTPKKDCPVCGEPLDAASAADGSDIAPTPGDISVCLYCASLLEFDERLEIMPLSSTTKATIDEDTLVMLHATQEMILQSLLRSATVH